MFKGRIIIFLALLCAVTQALGEYSEEDFKADWGAPLAEETSQNILIWGSGLTLGLILLREDFTDRIQEDMARNEPLGEFSKYGDLMGQMVPNFLYMGYQWKFGESVFRSRRLKLMFKASLFSGATTFFLKRLVNQRRPHKGDRNSFPSGHTTTAFAFSTVIALEHPTWAIPAYALSSFVGLSRMNDNAHYLHDVTMGATIGMAYGYAFFKNEDLLSYSAFPFNDGLILGHSKRF
jgi:hypothetical protein